MRLTLRTLLAYLDNTLPPEDAEVLRSKLAESGFATALVARIRQAISRSDLGSAPASAVNPVDDPNVVGEYLDSTMPPEQTAEIERATLENDARLAEMAACHQILTMVLGQSASVSDGLRRRVYQSIAQDAGDGNRSLVDPDGGGGSIATAETIQRVGNANGLLAADADPIDASRMGGDALDSDPMAADQFSSIEIPADQPAAMADRLGSGDSNDSLAGDDGLPPATTVVPVSKMDSGVSDAPTRIRRSDQSAVASRQQRSDYQTDSGPLRLTRVMPYLVGLGTLAVLLFALVQVFRPLLSREDTMMAENVTLPPLPRQDDSVAVAADGSAASALSASDGAMNLDAEQSLEDIEMVPLPSVATAPAADLPSPQPSPTENQKLDTLATTPPTPADLGVAVMPDELRDIAPTDPDDSSDPINPANSELANSEPANSELANAPEMDSAAAADGATDDNDTDVDDTNDDDMAEVVRVASKPDREASAEAMPDPSMNDDAAAADPSASGDKAFAAVMLESEQPTLLIGREAPAAASANNDQPMQAVAVAGDASGVMKPPATLAIGDPKAAGGWIRITPQTKIASATPLVVPPKFQVALRVSDGITLTGIGPAEISVSHASGTPVIELGYGRVVLRSQADDAECVVLVGPQRLACIFDEPAATMALSAIFRRQPGVPLMAPQRELQTSALVTAGTVDWVIEDSGESAPITGTSKSTEGWIRKTDIRPAVAENVAGDADANSLTEMEFVSDAPVTIQREPPAWATASIAPVAGADRLARQGLMELLVDDKPIEMSLREATNFRRAEVAALAGQSLLSIGRAEVYFGVDGLLAKPDQRTYWNDHFRMLTSMLDRGPSMAGSILDDINRMDHAGEPAIRRLLRGYTQAELAAGGDEELVAALNSPSMPIRVLAIENLQAITGKKLFYRPEYETEAKREAAIKKWQAWLRRGDIRWPEKADDA